MRPFPSPLPFFIDNPGEMCHGRIAVEWPKMKTSILKQPAFWIIAVVFLGIMTFAVWRGHQAGLAAPQRNGRGRADPLLLEDEVKTAQKQKTTVNETTIDLKNYVNATLSEPVASGPNLHGNTLEELPPGVHVYDGVPFDVSGTLQVTGPGILTRGQPVPDAINGIKIGRQFNKLHVLHGAGNVGPKIFGSVLAELVLHYADGSRRELDLVAGEHVLNWWGAVRQPNLPRVEKSGTKIAWIGSNPAIKESPKPGNVLHLYHTTFDNPQPGIEVTTIDYVSGHSTGSPFLVGLTVE
jgi:hypothetical protein